MSSRIRYKIRKKQRGGWQRKLKAHSAVVGHPIDNLVDTGLAGRSYVNIDGIVGAVYNTRGVNSQGAGVRVGRDPFEPDIVQILNNRARIGITGGTVIPSTVGPHAPTHRFLANNGGTDVVWVELRQFMPLRPGLCSTDPLSITISRGVAIVGGTAFYLAQTDVDLEALIPTNAGKAIYVTVYVDSAGALQTLAGSEVNVDDLALSDIDYPVGSYFLICAVRLYQSQTALVDSRSDTDILDLRYASTGDTSISIVDLYVNAITRITSAGVVEQYVATATGLTTCLGEAGSGDSVMLPAITITGNFICPAGVTIFGANRYKTVIEGLIVLVGQNSRIVEMTFAKIITGVGDAICIIGPETGLAYIDDCLLYATADSGDAFTIQMPDGDGNLAMRGTYVRAYSASGSAAVLIDYESALATGYAMVKECTLTNQASVFEAADANFDLFTLGGGDIHLLGDYWPPNVTPPDDPLIVYEIGDRQGTLIPAAPIAITDRDISLGYDTNDFQLSGSDLQLKDAGVDHGGVTGLADDDHGQYAALTPATAARNTIQPSADVVPLTAKGKAGQTANLQEWQNSIGTVLGSVSGTGQHYININSTTALSVEQDGVKDNVLVVDTTNGRVGVGVVPTIPFQVFAPSSSGNLALFEVGNSNGFLIGIKNTSGEWGFGESSTEDFTIRDVTSGNIDVMVLEQSAPVYSFVIDSSGFVGLGTNQPLTALDVRSIFGTTINIGRNDESIVSGNVIGKIQFWNNDTQLTTQNIYGSIEMQAAQTIATDAAAGNLIFKTTGTTVGSSPVERMMLNANGGMLITGGADRIQLIVKANVSQTANLTEWQNSSGTVLINIQPDGDLEFHANNIVTDTTTGTKIGTATNQKIGFFNATPVTQQTELTDELTAITHTAPGTPDYAVQDLIDSSAGATFGFATKDEGNTVLSVIANLQARVNELETKLVAYGLLADAD